ncbi:hypothetical protein [Chitinophaga arvensicola]|uniref:Uncharacterized protein n=1 Tax=Chitinophaga arvensicola TaxID=29529 RepID=A0A1I0SBJ9_9BACT|nr:hypothetical protein [Chitinophaga arvensicola]SEW54039.1 hypothetical protein SAMN04488122_5871 [Chitinophaga arvensicola]
MSVLLFLKLLHLVNEVKMELMIVEQLFNRLDALDSRLDAIQLLLKVMEVRIRLMESRIDYRFDRMEEQTIVSI